MLNQLLALDRQLFYVINHDLANPFFDWIMPWLRQPKLWIPLYIFIVCFCIGKFKKPGIVIIVFLALSAGFADFTGAGMVKYAVKRLRPCNDPVTVKTDILRLPACGTGYSFPSAHAADHFAAAFFMILMFYKKWRWIWLWGILWAGSISFAQVYVGVHYPIDVFCGALYGMLVALLFVWLLKKLSESEFIGFMDFQDA